jgi:hypothetical protein
MKPRRRAQAAFMTAWGIPEAEKAKYPFLAASRLWRHDKASDSATFTDDWFGRAVVRPDEALVELAAVVAGGAAAEAPKLYFFRNVARGDAVAGLTGTCAAAFGCEAYAQQTALVAPTAPTGGGGAPAAAPAAAPSGSCRSAAAAAAALVLAAAVALAVV